MDTKASVEYDRTVPIETVLSCAPGSGAFILVIAGGAFLVLAFVFIPAIYEGKSIDHHFIAQVVCLILVIAGSLWLFFSNRNAKTEFIVLNNKGISTPEMGFVEWSAIQNERVEHGRRSDCLQFDVFTAVDAEEDKTKIIDLDGYEIKTDRLEYLLQVYRKRYEQR